MELGEKGDSDGKSEFLSTEFYRYKGRDLVIRLDSNLASSTCICEILISLHSFTALTCEIEVLSPMLWDGV